MISNKAKKPWPPNHHTGPASEETAIGMRTKPMIRPHRCSCSTRPPTLVVCRGRLLRRVESSNLVTSRDGHRRFRISTMQRGSDRVVAGVASGVAEVLRVDPLIVRVGFVVLAVAGGIGIPLYFCLWWLMP